MFTEDLQMFDHARRPCSINSHPGQIYSVTQDW